MANQKQIDQMPQLPNLMRVPQVKVKGSSTPEPQKLKSIKIRENNRKHAFRLYGSWEALVGCKMLPQGTGTISTPRQQISEKSHVRYILVNFLVSFGSLSVSNSTGGGGEAY